MLNKIAPALTEVKALSDKSIKVTWTAPANSPGVTWYYATAKEGHNEHHCEVQDGTLSCEVQSLMPYTDYTVELVACDQKSDVSSRICSKVVAWGNVVKTLQSRKFVQPECPIQEPISYEILFEVIFFLQRSCPHHFRNPFNGGMFIII